MTRGKLFFQTFLSECKVEVTVSAELDEKALSTASPNVNPVPSTSPLLPGQWQRAFSRHKEQSRTKAHCRSHTATAQSLVGKTKAQVSVRPSFLPVLQAPGGSQQPAPVTCLLVSWEINWINNLSLDGTDSTHSEQQGAELVYNLPPRGPQQREG